MFLKILYAWKIKKSTFRIPFGDIDDLSIQLECIGMPVIS